MCVTRFIPLKIILALFCELLLLDVELYQLANLGWMSRHAVCLVLLVRYSRDLMQKQPTLMCVCAITAEPIPFLSPALSLAALFIALSSLPLCLYFLFLQTDSENRSLVRQRIRDGRSRQGRDLCENCHAVLITAFYAVKCPTCIIWVKCLSLRLSQFMFNLYIFYRLINIFTVLTITLSPNGQDF